MRVADELAKAMRKGVLKRTRRVRGKAELQRGGDLFAGFPEEMLNWMFLFLITRQYLLTTERTETTDKQKAKTSKRKKHTHDPRVLGLFLLTSSSPPIPTAADPGQGHISAGMSLTYGS